MASETLLWYYDKHRNGTSDKVYRAWINRDPKPPGGVDGYTVRAEFGKRGGNMQPTVKAGPGLSFFAARSALDLVIGEKTRKGYRLIPAGTSFEISIWTSGAEPQLNRGCAELEAGARDAERREARLRNMPIKKTEPLRKPKRAINLDD